MEVGDPRIREGNMMVKAETKNKERFEGPALLALKTEEIHKRKEEKCESL